MKASVVLFLWFSVLFHTSSCSSEAGVDNAATSNLNGAPVVENQSVRNVSDQSSPSAEGSPSQNPKDVVLFDGKNYIKKSGWKVPSYDDTYINDTYQLHGKPVEKMTENGKKVKMYAKQYIYKIPPRYSEEFNFKGDDLNYMKGALERSSFFEARANGKVFMYSVFMQKVPPAAASNSAHELPNQYQIQDTDGDGIFETMLGDYDEIIVPNWVLK